MMSITSLRSMILVVSVFTVTSATCAQSVVVKKEKVPSAAALNQEASELIGEILKTSAELVKELGTLQSSCLLSLERVVSGEGAVTKTKLSACELKKCVEELRTHNNSLKKLKQEVSSSCVFCSARF